MIRLWSVFIRRNAMGKLTFVFNQEKLKKYGKDEAILLKPIRDMAKEYGIEEIDHGVFQMMGNNAFAVLGGFVADITDQDHSYVGLLDKWELEVGGMVDDCIADTLEWYKEEGIAV